MTQRHQIAVIDDDKGALVSMRVLLEAAGYAARTYQSAELFLRNFEPAPACAIVDIHMPTIGGLELQGILAFCSIDLPIIFVTGHGNVPLAVQALQAGAADFIEKPFTAKAMLDSVTRALEIGQQSANATATAKGAEMMIDLLTPREHSVMDLLVAGNSTKSAAHALGISPRTTEIYRARIMDKLNARNISDVVRIAMTAKDPALRRAA